MQKTVMVSAEKPAPVSGDLFVYEGQAYHVIGRIWNHDDKAVKLFLEETAKVVVEEPAPRPTKKGK